MPLSSISNATDVANSKSTAKSSMLDSEAFLKMFIVSLQNQDPLEPMSNAEMMQQLTQLQNIETTLAMKDIVEDLLAREDAINPLSYYMDMIGKRAKVEISPGKYEEGTVLSIGQEKDGVVFEMMVTKSDGETTVVKAYDVGKLVGLTEY